MQYIDILALTETKLDATFTKAQFLLNGFSEPCRLDRSRNGGGVMIYIHENVPSKLLDIHVFPLEDLFVGFNFRKCKNRYFLKHTTHHTKQIFIVLIIQMKHLTLAVVMKNVNLLEILSRKYLSLVQILSFISMNYLIL